MLLANRYATVVGLCALVLAAACAKDTPEPETAKDAQSKAEPGKEQPPPPAEAKNLLLPPVEIAELDNGLQVNTIVADRLPVVYATLVIRSGAESDPAKLPGLSGLVAQMLKEGASVNLQQ